MSPPVRSGLPATLSRLLDPRRSTAPAVLAFLVGLGLFLLDAARNPRPGPVLYLLTPTPVALSLYLRVRPTTGRRRLVALAAVGFLGTMAAGILTIIVALGTRLPRPYDAWELFVLDVGVFVWFVVALAGAFVVAARTPGRRALVALAAGPVTQFTGFLLTVVLAAESVVLVVPVSVVVA